MKYALAILMLLLSVACSDSVTGPAPWEEDVLEGPYQYEGHIYYLLNPGTWTEAHDIAVMMGGNLVTVNSAEENEWLVIQFSPDSNRCLWTGLNDVLEEGVFVWTSGEEVTYTNWAWCQPDNMGGAQSYVYIVATEPPFTAEILQWDDEMDVPSWEPWQGIFHGVVEIPSAGMSAVSWGSIKRYF